MTCSIFGCFCCRSINNMRFDMLRKRYRVNRTPSDGQGLISGATPCPRFGLLRTFSGQGPPCEIRPCPIARLCLPAPRLSAPRLPALRRHPALRRLTCRRLACRHRHTRLRATLAPSSHLSTTLHVPMHRPTPRSHLRPISTLPTTHGFCSGAGRK